MILANLSKYRIVLASNSPRRKELLAGLDIDFTVRTLSGIDESYPSHLTGEDIPLYICRQKSKAYQASMASDELIITADTVVLSDGQVLGKPHSEDEARRMLHRLSGRTHEVTTGVSVTTVDKQSCFAVTSRVSFACLTEEEIDYYVNRYHPLDKAGAYGIQEWIGFIGVDGLSGSYFNVMGLPVQRLYTVLKNEF